MCVQAYKWYDEAHGGGNTALNYEDTCWHALLSKGIRLGWPLGKCQDGLGAKHTTAEG